MNVKKAARADIPSIGRFQMLMAEETENIRLEERVVQQGVEAVFNDPSRGFYIVVEDGPVVVACMLLTPEWSDWRNSMYLWIQSLYVSVDYRNRGIFRSMYDFVQELVTEKDGYAGIKLYVDKENTRAQEVYARVGMHASHYRLYEWNKKNQ